MDEKENQTISINDVTNKTINTVSGDGAYDHFIVIATEEIETHFKKGHINAQDYVKFMMSVVPSTLQSSMSFAKIKYDIELQKEKIESEKLQRELLRAQIDLANKNLEIADAKLLIEQQRVDVEKAKLLAEQAKTKDEIDGVPIAGVIGRQMVLYSKQAEGFDRSAEQKAAKIMADAWSMLRSTDPDVTTIAGTGMEYPEIKKTIDKMKEGAGIQAS